MLDKIEILLKGNFQRIQHYDLMFYSEMTKKLQSLFGPLDEKCQAKSLRQPDGTKD